MTTMMTTVGGSYLTFPATDDTVRMVQRLEEALGCKVKTSFAPNIDSRNWLAFDLPKHLHVAARMYIRAYREGAKDGVDRHCGFAYGAL